MSTTDLPLMRFSFGKNKFDNKPINQILSWNDFGKFISNNKTWAKGFNYITGFMSHDGRRCKNNALNRAWLPFDMDGNLSDIQAKSLIKFFSGLRCYLYETASSKPNHRRLRLIVACNREVDNDESFVVCETLSKISPIQEGWDSSVYRSYQPIYLPSIDKDILELHGNSLEIDSFLKKIPRKIPTVKVPKNIRHHKKNINAYEFFSKNGLILNSRNSDCYQVVCPWANEHSDQDITGTAFFPNSSLNNFSGGFKCHHKHCETRNIRDIYNLMGVL